MRVRVQFEKTGPLRFVGHLDFMRTFQKIIKRSGLDAVYTAGFNPHMVLSFADPLGVGQESTSEFADIEFAWKDTAPLTEQELYRLTDIGLDNASLPLPPSSKEVVAALNAVSPAGVRFKGAVRVGLIRSSKAMALVRYASWTLALRNDALPDTDLRRAAGELLKREEIVVHKVTKKSETDVDIRPLILSLDAAEGDACRIAADDPAYSDGRALSLLCAAGSYRNLKPQTVLEALCRAEDPSACLPAFRLMRTGIFDENRKSLLEGGSSF